MALLETLAGGYLLNKSMGKAADAQTEANQANLAEQQRVREQLRRDTDAQRTIADTAFDDYNKGLISFAEAQQRTGNAIGDFQKGVSQSQLKDTQTMTDMANFRPYSIKSGTGSTYFDKETGAAGYNLSPELQRYQSSLYNTAGQAAGALTATPEQAAARWMEQQQGLLQPQRQSEDIALRQQQLQRGRIGLGISSEAAGAGSGGYVNPEQFQRDRARALADAQLAANATQQGQQQMANQLSYTQGLFNAGVAPDRFGMEQLQLGGNLGAQQAQAGAAQAGIYGAGMGNVYDTMGRAAQNYAESGLRVPQAMLTGAQESYNRQQTGLTNLQGSPLPYQAMNMPAPVIPGSAYVGANIGNRLLNIGLNQKDNQII